MDIDLLPETKFQGYHMLRNHMLRNHMLRATICSGLLYAQEPYAQGYHMLRNPLQPSYAYVVRHMPAL